MNWNNLNILQKLIVGFIILLIAATTPELMLLVDLGGIELAMTALVWYLRPVIAWMHLKCRRIKEVFFILQITLKRSAWCQPKVFVTQAAFSVTALFLTSSLALSIFFFIPGILFNSALV
ncbi:hypothetical protein [Planctobacterium marinum]|uniref:hypothetical protein n=1 Tax=Planctobacterium marinum TaxID=1631968 RepID=UPI001E4628C2|nr:hypothetical protein [Planctobacterium marinum]MCC2604512.1 hypothetical protein [Planctobacterium marinum]